MNASRRAFALGLLFVGGQRALAQDTTRVSVDSSGGEANADCFNASISADGRYVAFDSVATDLVTGDHNHVRDIFVHDRLTGVTERVSVDSSGAEGNAESQFASISADGRFVSFMSRAANLVPGDVNLRRDVFVRDRIAGTTEIASVDSSGVQGDFDSGCWSISADGRFVAFWSYATNLVPGDTNGVSDVFVRDRQAGTTERVSVDSSGAEADDFSGAPMISADGQAVAFSSSATNLVAGDTNGMHDIFVHDRQTGTTERVSVDSAGMQGPVQSYQPSISANGRLVAFFSLCSFVPGDTNAYDDVYVRNRSTGKTQLMSADPNGIACGTDSSRPAISGNGRFVAFSSGSRNLVPGDTNGRDDVFVHDRQTGATSRESVSGSGTEGDGDSSMPALSDDGRFVAFSSVSDNLVSGDTNGVFDVFVHGPYLTVEAEPQDPVGGATLTFTTWTGMGSAASLLVASDVNGTPTFIPVVFGTFDAAGHWVFSATVPSGLTGNVVTFETFGIVPTGKVDVSNAVDVSFQ